MRGGSVGEGTSSKIRANGLRMYGMAYLLSTCPCGLLATPLLAAFIINIQFESFSINVLNTICLNSFRIKSCKAVDAGVNKIRVE